MGGGEWETLLDRGRLSGDRARQASVGARTVPGREGGSNVEMILFLSLVLFSFYIFLLYTITVVCLFLFSLLRACLYVFSCGSSSLSTNREALDAANLLFTGDVFFVAPFCCCCCLLCCARARSGTSWLVLSALLHGSFKCNGVSCAFPAYSYIWICCACWAWGRIPTCPTR